MEDIVLEIEEAIKDCTKEIKNFELFNNTLFMLRSYKDRAALFETIKQYDKAISDYEFIIQNCDEYEYSEIYYLLANCYKKMKEYDKANKNYNKSIEYYTSAIIKAKQENANPWIKYTGRANCYKEMELYDKSLNDYTTSIELLSSNYTRGYYLRADCYLRMGYYDKALKDINLAIESASDNTRLCFTRDLILSKLGQTGKDTSLKNNYYMLIDNEYCTSYLSHRYFKKAHEYYDSDNYEKALEFITKCFELQEVNESKPYNLRACCYYEMGEYEKAICDYTKQIEKDLPYADYYDYAQRASCYEFLKKYENAVDDYTKALELYLGQEKKKEFLLGRANCYLKSEQYSKAIEDYEKVSDLCDEDDEMLFEALYNGIGCYVAVKDYDSAMVDCKYILDNEDIFYYVDEEIISNIEYLYERLSNSEPNEDDDENEDDFEEFNNSENKKCSEHLKIFSDYYFQNKPRQAIVELAKAYAIDSKYVLYFVDVFGNATGETQILNFQSSALKLFEDMENSGMSKEEIVQYMENKCNNQSNIDISALHHNPKKGRKLDL